MISNAEFIRQSLELNLFFLRIMKEHTVFMAASLTPRDAQLASQALNMQNVLGGLLATTLALADGYLSKEALSSGEFVTNLTYNAERMTEFYTGIPIDSNITIQEMALTGTRQQAENSQVMQQVFMLNQQVIYAVTQLISMKTMILENVLACRMFTTNYPHMLDHIIDEARYYVRTLARIQNREETPDAGNILEQEVFWDHIMGDHAKFIRGMLDPMEEPLIQMADKFAKEFDKLEKEAKSLMAKVGLLPKLTRETIDATTRLRDFKRQGAEGILACKVRSIILPLLADHVLREANHYLRLLREFTREVNDQNDI